jgi:hypothetical protein
MQVTAILKARAVALMFVDELNLSGKMRFADLVSPLIKQYGFLTYPLKPEDFDSAKGIKFGSGRSDDKVIDLLTFYPGLITLETLSSTTDSRDVLENMLQWGKEELGLTYHDGMVRHWAYISQISFNSDFPLLSHLSKPLHNLGLKTGQAVSAFFGENLPYEVAKVNVGHDPLSRSNAIAGVTIEHRSNTPFGENRFFSEAPLPTDLHIQFLKELEAEVLESMD